MFTKIINSLVEILNKDAYTNIEVNKNIKLYKFNDNDKRLYTRYVYGTVENKILLDYLMQPLTKGKRIKPFIKNALRCGVYGIDFLDMSNIYIIDSIVEAVKKEDYKASKFVNAILRKYITSNRRSLNGLDKLTYLSTKYSISYDLTKLLYFMYKDQFETFFINDGTTTNTYRINTLKTTIDNISDWLGNNKIDYRLDSDTIITQNSLIGTELFKKGMIVAQDKSSIRVGKVLNPKENSLVLDACSAPGSKSMHLASIMNNTGVIKALDVHEHKIELIKENASRLGVTNVIPILADATTYKTLDEYDYILTDVPCSGLGVLRHKPDIKYQMTLDKISDIKLLQKAIVENVIKYLKKDGILVYSTCTINKEENEYFIEEFLKCHKEFTKLEEISVLPSKVEDGFYICKMRKN